MIKKCEPIPYAALLELEEMEEIGKFTPLGWYVMNKVMPMCKGLEDL